MTTKNSALPFPGARSGDTVGSVVGNAADPTALIFTVLGRPVPQGSMVAVMMGKRPQIIASNKKELFRWRDKVGATARSAADAIRWPLVTVPVAVRVDARFYFTPAAAASARGQVFPANGNEPDLDKLVRSLLDALTQSKAVFRDDSQVADLRARKVWTRISDADGELTEPGVRVRVAML